VVAIPIATKTTNAAIKNTTGGILAPCFFLQTYLLLSIAHKKAGGAIVKSPCRPRLFLRPAKKAFSGGYVN